MLGGGGGGGGWLQFSANEYSYAHGAQVNFGDQTPHVTYGSQIWGFSLQCFQTTFAGGGGGGGCKIR
jgi:hypothetical protein